MNTVAMAIGWVVIVLLAGAVIISAFCAALEALGACWDYVHDWLESRSRSERLEAEIRDLRARLAKAGGR